MTQQDNLKAVRERIADNSKRGCRWTRIPIMCSVFHRVSGFYIGVDSYRFVLPLKCVVRVPYRFLFH